MANSTFSKKLVTYLFLLLSIFFTLGTFTLSLIIKSMAIYIRHTGWLASHENFVFFCIIFVLIFFTMLFAKWLTIWFTESSNTTSKITFSVLLTLSMITCSIYWLPAKEAPFSPTLVSDDKRFTGGPYPDAAKLAKLKSEGYTTIVSLLDPLLFPSEPFLIKEEEKAVTSLGLNLIRVPLISGKVQSIEANKRIESLARSQANEKYYVHGYRDPERVLLFLKQINKSHVGASGTTSISREPVIQSAKIINDRKTISLDRGDAIQLDNHVIVSPKPTMEEFKRYFLATPNSAVYLPIHSVISLNPDESPAETSEMMKLLKSHHIDYYSMPVQLYPYDPEVVSKIVARVKSLPGGVLIYSYYMPPQSMAISAFILSYLTNLPALPGNLFAGNPMQGGLVKSIAPNVAMGPRPQASEFSEYLKEHGIRGIGYAGPCDSKESQNDEQLATTAGLKWVCLQANDTIVLNALKSAGPWYVYGPVLPLIEAEITKRLGKTMPLSILQGSKGT